ncbi:MAG: hypothetical protein U1E17_02895 [Geminicoccaceae bacterium]
MIGSGAQDEVRCTFLEQMPGDRRRLAIGRGCQQRMPSRASWAAQADDKAGRRIRSSVKSGGCGEAHQALHPPGRASATSSMIQPPMLEPTSTTGPSTTRSRIASAFSRQADRAVREALRPRKPPAAIVEAAEGLAAGGAVALGTERLAAGHVGAEAGQEQTVGAWPGKVTCRPAPACPCG